MAHLYLFILLSIGLFAGPVRAQTIYQGGNAGGDYSTQVSNASLPAELLYFTAEILPAGSTLTHWATAYEADIDHYAVETSADGRHFTEVARQSVANAAGGHTYRLEVSGSSPAYYRLRIAEADGRAWYSAVVRTAVDEISWDFRPLTNPQRGTNPKLITSGLSGGNDFVTVHVADAVGRVVHHNSYSAFDQQITLPVRLTPATYVVTLAVAGKQSRAHRLVITR